MTGLVSTERIFALSCFEGLRLLRRYAQKYSEKSDEEVFDLVMKLEADAQSLDMAAAIYLHKLVAADCPIEGTSFYQNCIKAVVVTHQPIWAKAMRQGRVRFTDGLSRDDKDVFSAAGLMSSPPSVEVVTWWDDVVGHARLTIDMEKMEQARKAEALTIKNEIQRLKQLNILKTPKWVGLDDNFAGYDVLSFDLCDGAEVNKMIEVKSTINSPLRFIVTRNEWETADKIGPSYSFHVWNMASDPPEVYERSVEDIRPHIPTDNENGRWADATIPIGT